MSNSIAGVWVKSSVKPKKTKEYPIKWDSPRPKGNRNFDVAVFGADERWYIYDSEMNDCDEMWATDFMWLDEQPIPVKPINNELVKNAKNSVAIDKGYPSWEEMENFIIDHNKPVVVAQLLVAAMEDVINKLQPIPVNQDENELWEEIETEIYNQISKQDRLKLKEFDADDFIKYLKSKYSIQLKSSPSPTPVKKDWQTVLRKMKADNAIDDKFNPNTLEFNYAFQLGFKAANPSPTPVQEGLRKDF